MKKSILVCMSLTLLALQVFAKVNVTYSEEQLGLLENKGQVKDQFGMPRNDLQFVVHGNGVSVFVGSGKLQYQFCRQTSGTLKRPQTRQFDFTPPQNGSFDMYRLDVTLVGANSNAEMVAEDIQPYYENYFGNGAPAEGRTVRSFGKVIYKNVYRNIDWVIQVKNGKLEHEFNVHPGGKVSDIRIKYGGQTSVSIGKDGSITAKTPLGVVQEQAPVCFSNGKKIASEFSLSGDELTYRTASYKGGVLIDPVLSWGTYYGPRNFSTFFSAVLADDSGNVYSCGSTYASTSDIATTGSYQATFGGGVDAILVKFDSSGHRIWATYFGGSGGDLATGLAYDHAGNIYMTGYTTSIDSIATPGVFQTSYMGGTMGNNTFLAQFSTAGGRKWATYMGGAGIELYLCICCDDYGHIFMSGVTTCPSRIATPGAHLTSMAGARDCFLVKFDSSGHKIWGTYYGGPDDDFGGECTTDGYFVYLSGWTMSASGIATPGAHKPTITPGGSSDAFLIRFDSSGSVVWGTYFGGPAGESTGGLLYSNGGIYLLGTTGSDTGIALPGAFQPTRAGNGDAFLARFIPDLGAPGWATYYGGPLEENTDFSRLAGDNSGNICITGYTTSTTGIASPCAWQSVYGGDPDDAFLAKYDSNGVQLWSSYYGGSNLDVAWGCASYGNVAYICGYTQSTNNIATSGSFLDTGGTASYQQGFLARISEEQVHSSIDTMVCATSDTETVTLTAPDGASYRWFDADTGKYHNVNGSGGYWVSYSIGCTRIIDTIRVAYNTDSPPCFDHTYLHGVNGPDELVSIFPNPAANQCTVRVPDDIKDDAALEIYDVTGRMLLRYPITGAKTTVSVANLPDGVYLCRISHNGNLFNAKKLIISR